ncbi:hypothetical protein Leryth_007859 [Lithospermum erythrorhizon]|nr:hypothetical protein Leryth_007859 [Lithospermum erythrorhizon]
MFDGVPEQFHQFITSRTSLPPLAHHLQQQQQQQHRHQLFTCKDDKKEDQNNRNSLLLESNIVLEQRERSIVQNCDLWSEDEVLTLLRIRSSMESWFPEFTWEHVSRKLAELGFKRSAEKCKEKFEEEGRNFNNSSYNKNYRIYTELDEIYHGENAHVKSVDEKNQNLENQNEAETEKDKADEANNNISIENEAEKQQEKISKKRKKKYNFKEVKLFCETIVNKIMDQQEELQKKFIEEMLKRDEELIAKEEAWKNQELEKLNKEIEMIRVKQQAIENDRQNIIILEFLKKFTSNPDCSHKDQDLSKKIQDFLKVINNPPGEAIIPQNPNFNSIIPSKKITNFPTSSTETQSSQNPSSIIQPTQAPNENSTSTQTMSTQNPNFDKMHENSNTLANAIQTSLYKQPVATARFSRSSDDTGKRWPKDEVLALINLRCNFNNININNNCDDDNKESGGGKCPLLERISQGMEKLGYKRSAKRCKEKWENINKYFRKTKDNKKKRSLDSKTCPYFHQLCRLYSSQQGTVVAPTGEIPENRQILPENSHKLPENNHIFLETTSLASPDVPNEEGL